MEREFVGVEGRWNLYLTWYERSTAFLQRSLNKNVIGLEYG